VLCLLEHKHKLESFVGVQLLGYQAAIWEWFDRAIDAESIDGSSPTRLSECSARPRGSPANAEGRW